MFCAAWYGQDAHTSYFLAFYFFTILLFSVPLQGKSKRVKIKGYDKSPVFRRRRNARQL